MTRQFSLQWECWVQTGERCSPPGATFHKKPNWSVKRQAVITCGEPREVCKHLGCGVFLFTSQAKKTTEEQNEETTTEWGGILGAGVSKGLKKNIRFWPFSSSKRRARVWRRILSSPPIYSWSNLQITAVTSAEKKRKEKKRRLTLWVWGSFASYDDNFAPFTQSDTRMSWRTAAPELEGIRYVDQTGSARRLEPGTELRSLV